MRDGQWYVYAFCRLREDFRFFKLNRIFGCTKTQEKFSPRPFDGRLADFNERKSPRTDVTIAFKPSVLAEVEEWLGVENVVKSKDGNGYWGFGSFPYDKMLVSKIMGFGSNVKVLRPAKLVSEIRKIAKTFRSCILCKFHSQEKRKNLIQRLRQDGGKLVSASLRKLLRRQAQRIK